MKLIISLLAYFIVLIFVGFSLLFLLIGDGFDAWPDHVSTVIRQFSFPRRAPFALLIVSFVIAVPTIVAIWHWRRMTLDKQPSAGSMAGRTAIVSTALYGGLGTAALALADTAPTLSVMEDLNLKFSIILLGVWSALATLLTILSAAAVNRLVRPRPPQSSGAS